MAVSGNRGGPFHVARVAFIPLGFQWLQTATSALCDMDATWSANKPEPSQPNAT